jgi:uncharacterized protein with FMN-binding domain
MRRAIIATAGTVVGLVALLDYRSSGGISRSKVAVSVPGASRPTAGSTTTAPAPAASSPPTTTDPSLPLTTGRVATTTAPPTTQQTTPAPAAPASYTGTDIQYRYGDIQVRITVAGGRITNISIPEESSPDGRSQSINDQATPILTSEALAAQGLNFDVVSGATFTSDAFAQALQSALAKAGK